MGCEHLDSGNCRLAAQLSGLRAVPVKEGQCAACSEEPVPRAPNRVTASIAMRQAMKEGRYEQVRPRVVHLLKKVELGEGAGTELHKLMSRVGIHPSPGCKCPQHILAMNRNGTKWCRDNTNVIYGWLKEEAERQGIAWNRVRAFGARRMIGIAIRRAEKMQRKA